MGNIHDFIDFFAGCGGLSLGLEQAGFTPVLVNEIVPQFSDAYRKNRNLDKGASAVRENSGVMDMITVFDNATICLFSEWLKGKSLEERFFCDWNKNGKWQNPKCILHIETTFDLTCPTAEGFESEDLINAVATIHEAVWTLHETA